MYEILAFWNKESKIPFENMSIYEKLKFNGTFPMMKEIDEYTDDNRGLGIDIGCYDKQVNELSTR